MMWGEVECGSCGFLGASETETRRHALLLGHRIEESRRNAEELDFHVVPEPPLGQPLESRLESTTSILDASLSLSEADLLNESPPPTPKKPTRKERKRTKSAGVAAETGADSREKRKKRDRKSGQRKRKETKVQKKAGKGSLHPVLAQLMSREQCWSPCGAVGLIGPPPSEQDGVSLLRFLHSGVKLSSPRRLFHSSLPLFPASRDLAAPIDSTFLLRLPNSHLRL